MLAFIPFGMFAQNSVDAYALTDEVFSTSYADLGNDLMAEDAEEARDDAAFKVSDLLLADPDFYIQDDMISYTKDQKTVFFSANKKIKVKKGSESDIKIKKSTQLQLFKANVKADGEWVNLEMLPFSSSSHSTGHPALNADDTQLYFVSDGPESTGKTDIFVVDLLEGGTYGSPKNLGSKINTEEREVFPFVDESSVLYFASDIETEGDKLNAYASQVIDNEPSAPIKLNVDATASKDDYIAAYTAIDAEEIRLAEEAANLRDLEILMVAENLAEIESLVEVLADDATGTAYDFNTENVVYTVQIGAFIKNVKTDSYSDSSTLFNHLYADGYNRFYSGTFESLNEAEDHLKQMKEEGFDDAFVLGLNGKKRFLPE